MKINLQNVGDIILSDNNIKKLLPDLSNYFDSWKLGMMVPVLRPTAKKAALQVLEELTGDRLLVLEKHFQEKITVESINYNIVKTVEIPISELEFELQKYDRYQVCLTTDNKNAKVTFWR